MSPLHSQSQQWALACAHTRTHTHARMHTHARTHAHMHTRPHTHMHTLVFASYDAYLNYYLIKTNLIPLLTF